MTSLENRGVKTGSATAISGTAVCHTLDKISHGIIFHHLKTKMTWLLLVVPMVESNQKRLYAIEHLIASFCGKKVCAINYDHQPIISIG